WSEWRAFPDPRKGAILVAPNGPGVYERRLRSTGQFVRVGESVTVAKRMKSLLPHPHGSGTRRNIGLRNFVLAFIEDIEYRTLSCETEEEAKNIQDELLATGKYMFNT